MSTPHPPDRAIDTEALERGQHALILDAAWASLTGSLSSGVVLAAFALALGAGPLQIGALAAAPYIAQIAQIPAISLIERLRRRRLIGVVAVTIARVIIVLLAFLPFVASSSRVNLLICAQIIICGCGAFGGCAINSWMHQLLPRETLGSFFSRQLFGSTVFACVGTLAAGYWIDRSTASLGLHSYGLAFAAAGLAGFVSSYYLSRVPEPRMQDAGPAMSLLSRLRVPVQDRRFRRLLVLLAAWNLASNIAAPFLTVYLLQQLGYGLSVVTGLWVVSQVANVTTIYAWGRLSDRLSNKGVLSVAFPAYFACFLSLVFIAGSVHSTLQVWALAGMHVVMGVSAGGIGLATGNLGLKLAPQGQATTYLAMTGIVTAIVGGIAPLAAGALAQELASSELTVLIRWVASTRRAEVSVFDFAHWEFLFALSAVLGLLVLHALSRAEEDASIGEVSERQVIQEFALEAIRTVNHLSSIGGVLGSLFPFQRLSERRSRSRVNSSE